MTFYIFLAALLPVVLLLVRIWHKDRLSPEPTGQLVKAFLWGCVTPFVSVLISTPLQEAGYFPLEVQSIGDAIRISFYGAAIPEELAKLAILWLFLRRCRHFDEHMDGIVYAVCVSLGFAAVENLMYLFGNSEEWLSVGISRALFAIPGHMGFGILMGYYYSLACFSREHKLRNCLLTIVAPVLAHGIYDSLLFLQQVPAVAGGLLTLLFLWFCYKLWKRGSNSIALHVGQDQQPDKETGAMSNESDHVI